MKITLNSMLLAVYIAAAPMAAVASDLPTPSTEKEMADQLVSWSAGFCKSMEEKQGLDFVACFKRVTDKAIAGLEQESKVQTNAYQKMHTGEGESGGGVPPGPSDTPKGFGTYPGK